MKKYLAIIATALLCLSACEKDSKNGEQHSSVNPDITPEQEFWGVVGQLVSMNDITSDYEGKTFQPIIGTEVEPGVRVVGVNSLQAAVERYNSLVGASIDTNTVSHTYSSKEVGTLSWSKNTDNKAWATVDVSIPAVPTLQKIVYRSSEQGDVNGGVGNGYRAYYRFGDVVRRVRAEDNAVEYWVCVRPAFHHEDKGKSHWITLSPLPDTNIWPYNKDGNGFTASNGYVYGLPTNLRDDLEWPQDFAEMLFAICYPNQWASNITSYSKVNMFGSPKGLPIFNDFHSTNIKYHNQYFWENVRDAWVSKSLFPLIFGQSVSGRSLDLDWFSNKVKLDGAGLNFLYNGYSWWTSTSNTAYLYQVNFKSATNKDGTTLNMHSKTTSKPSHQVVNSKNLQDNATNIPFNVKSECNPQVPYVQKPAFFGDDEPRWIIRYAEGSELASDGVEDPQFQLRGVETVYRYYDVYEQNGLPTDPPEETKKEKDGYIGMAHYRWGNVYSDETGSKWYVMNQAGYDTGYDDLVDQNERSPYSELISITPGGMKLSMDTQYVENLPTLDEAVRSVMFFHMVFNSLFKKTEQDMLDDHKFGKTAVNIRDYAKLDLSNLFQLLVPQDKVPRHGSHALTVAYRIPGLMAQQPLLRCIINNQAPDGMPQFYFWTHYPSNPDNETQKVTNFGTDLITLSDLADQKMVNKYAIDTYAVCPVSTNTDPNSNENVARPVRTTTDSDARNIPLYYYDMAKWSNLTYKRDMWNAPILFFRYTRVKDRGDQNFSTQTEDGHTLSLDHARQWTGMSDWDTEAEAYNEIAQCQTPIWDNMTNVYVDGAKYRVKRWNEFPQK